MTQKECWSREIDWYSARHDTIEYHMTTFLRHGEVKGITCNTHALTDKFIADELNRKRVFKQIPVTPSDIIICALFSWKKWMNSGQLIPRFDLSYDGQYWISLAGVRKHGAGIMASPRTVFEASATLCDSVIDCLPSRRIALLRDLHQMQSQICNNRFGKFAASSARQFRRSVSWSGTPINSFVKYPSL